MSWLYSSKFLTRKSSLTYLETGIIGQIEPKYCKKKLPRVTEGLLSHLYLKTGYCPTGKPENRKTGKPPMFFRTWHSPTPVESEKIPEFLFFYPAGEATNGCFGTESFFRRGRLILLNFSSSSLISDYSTGSFYGQCIFNESHKIG